MKHSTADKIHKKSNNAHSNGVIRIIGGNMRGRKLKFSDSEGLRPTLDRIRETLFNWLARDIYNSHCLDLFAGSGALGFEAASRGAKQVTMVELSAKVTKDLKSNCQLLKAGNIEVVNQPADRFLQMTQQKFDLVFLDPPFGKNLLKETLERLVPNLVPDALIYIEQEHASFPFVPGQKWQQLKFKKTASFSYALYQLK